MDRDRTVGETFYLLFTTRAFSTGIPGTLGGTPGVSAIEDNSATPITAGITLGVDHATVTGLNLLTIVATGANGFEAGKDYSLYIDAGTVDSVSVIGEVVGSFSLGLSAAFTRLGAPAGASVSADIAAVEAQTDDIGVAGAGLTDLGGMSTGMRDEVGDATWDEDIVAAHGTADTAGLILRALGALISQRTNNATLEALLGVADSAGVDLSEQIWTEALTLPGQTAPPLSPEARQALGHIYKAYRNRKRETTTQWSLFADDETTVDQKAVVSDAASITTKEEIVSGP